MAAVTDIPSEVREFIRSALAEDIGHGDLTTMLIVHHGQKCRADIIAREGCTLAGLPFAFEAFRLLDPELECKALKEEGARVKAGETVARISGHTRPVLTAERTALNMIQRMTGIATLTSSYVDAVIGTRSRILDTRKTTPMMRFLEKYAVRMGGGRNHRFGLYDGILIKDNHIMAAGSITSAVKRARGTHPFMKIEVEAETLKDVKEAVEAGASIVMLDNMSPAQMKKAVEVTDGRAELEASGGVTLKNVRKIAETGVDFISVGALTHSAHSADMSLEILDTD
jgi:nicotinate-nucleotide pyrophosphorylase (carboxylating)